MIHHQRPNGWTACGRSPDLVSHDSGTGEGVDYVLSEIRR